MDFTFYTKYNPLNIRGLGWLFGRLVVWSFGCLVVWLFGGWGVWGFGGWGFGGWGGFILLRKHRNRRDVVRRVRRCVGGAIGKSNNLFTCQLVYLSTRLLVNSFTCQLVYLSTIIPISPQPSFHFGCICPGGTCR